MENIIETYKYKANLIRRYADFVEKAGVDFNSLLTKINEELNNNGFDIVSNNVEITDDGYISNTIQINDVSQMEIPEEYEEENVIDSVNNMLYDIARSVETSYYNPAKRYLSSIEIEATSTNSIVVIITPFDEYNTEEMDYFDR